MKSFSRGHSKKKKKLNARRYIFKQTVSRTATNYLKIYDMFMNSVCCNYIEFH